MTDQLRNNKQLTGQTLVNKSSMHPYPEWMRHTREEQETTDTD